MSETEPSTSAPSDTHEVITPDGVAEPGSGLSATGGAAPSTDGPEEPEGSEIESPAKIIRIGAMVKQLLEEVRGTTLDDAARGQLRRIYDSSITELKSALSPDLGEELDSLSFDFSAEEPPSEAELRMAQAQLVGWLEGLFHGIQATLVAQQMAARQQLDGVRGQLPQGPGGAPTPGPGYI
jgi:hypothetical protein